MKPLTHQILRTLADGEFHSGERLARALGVSRASVWNAVRGLDALGLEVYRVRGRGYRLSEPLQLLDAAAVRRHLGRAAARFSLEMLDEVESTNSHAMQRALAGAPAGTVVVAESQSAGRGRQGRAWHSAVGGALTFSLIWRFGQGAGFLSGLSLAVGVAIVRALEKLGLEGVALKWPNDVLWEERKLAGILIEMQGDALGPGIAVIGVGLNVRMTDAMRRRISQPATDLATVCGAAPDRNRVLALLLAELGSVLDAFGREGFAPLRAEWQRRHAFRDRSVALALPDARRETGIARGVSDDGALLVETRAGMQRFHSGEVSLRSAGPVIRGR